jgi:hypothetical protein
VAPKERKLEFVLTDFDPLIFNQLILCVLYTLLVCFLLEENYLNLCFNALTDQTVFVHGDSWQGYIL